MVSPTRSEELLFGMFTIFFYFLKIIGLAPVSLQTKARVRNSHDYSIEGFVFSKIGLFYNLVYLILVHIVGVILTEGIVGEDDQNEFSLTRNMYKLQEIVVTCTGWFIIVYWAFRQKQAAIFMNKLVEVHRLLSSLKEKSSHRMSFVSMAVHVAFNVLLWTVSFVSSIIWFSDHGSVLGGFFALLPTFVVYWFFVEYSMILVFVKREFEILNKNLSNLRELPEYLFRTPTPNHHAVHNSLNQSQLALLELLRSICVTLLDACQDIGEFFSPPILLAVGSFSLSLIYAVYYLTYPILISPSHTTLISYVISTAWVLIALYPLLLLSYNVTDTANNAKLTGQIIHKLLPTTINQEVVEKLKLFYCQVTHEEVNFTAYGFFPLDFTLIQSTFGTTITYLVIVMQFAYSAETQNRNRMNNTPIT